MLPGVYEFAWDAGHIIFLGAFFTVVALIGATVAAAFLMAKRDAKRVEEVRWHLDFEDLPPAARVCRHELNGEVKQRTCENGFDCRHCSEHVKLERPLPASCDGTVGGLKLPGDRLYHRGHTWVRREDDGTLTVGLDDLGSRLVRDGEVKLPRPGARLTANGTGWEVKKRGTRVRVLAPVDGTVCAAGGAEDDWVLRIRPEEDRADVRHLLNAAEARSWMLREFDRLQMAVGGSLADGGVPVDDLADAIPKERFDEICGLMFLEP